MKTLKCDIILSHMKPGIVYRRESLSPFSNNLDRDLHSLVTENKLKKPAAGLYLKPKQSRFGTLPPTDEALVRAFLKKSFLIYSWNDYNTLSLGLTQLYNETVVYNHERHEKIKLSGRSFAFKRPNNGFPVKLTREFLLIDLLNNAKYLTEDVNLLQDRIANKLHEFNTSLLYENSMKYGKIASRKFIKSILGH